MNDLPLVSIIIPCYNRAEETVQAISSALRQTYINTEIIVVDDGSNNETLTKLSSLKAPFKLLRHETNKGANAARNTGLKSAHGKWIAFLDSDDTWDKNKIQIILENLLSQPQYSLGYCSMYSIQGDSVKSKFNAVHSGNIYERLLEKNVVGSASIPIIKKDVLVKVNGFDEKLRSAQDWDLWLRIAEAGYSFLAIQDPMVYYKFPDSQQHISGSEDAFWEGRKAFISKHFEKYKQGHTKALGKVYSDTGFILLNRFHNTHLSRRCFLKALHFHKTRLKSWKGLLGTMMPLSLYKKFNQLENTLGNHH
ncbi:glycosyltransferase family 2 protein [Gracilimonas sp.]|uniref:glycosyltransferase family 2 protein n=1 Tax=Gracilimonas sp. TaxID=1974203 RepID=UPI003BA97D6B